MFSPVFHPWYIFNNCYSLASILVTDIMFWKRDAMWMHSELVWSSQVQVAYEPQRVGAPGKWCYTPVFSAPPPASFHPGGNWQLLSGTVRGLSHTLAHFISTLFLWSGCFLSPFYWGGNWGSDGFNDWSTMPLLLRGRVRIWASEPVPWAAEAQWWSRFKGASERIPEQDSSAAGGVCVEWRRGLPWWPWLTIVLSVICGHRSFFSPRCLPFPWLPCESLFMAMLCIRLSWGPGAAGGFVASRGQPCPYPV